MTASGFDEGSASVTGIGALNLTSSGSTIDFGTGDTSALAFAIFNPGSDSLTIETGPGRRVTQGMQRPTG